jgi:F420H(2)-dependent quinone reductase
LYTSKEQEGQATPMSDDMFGSNDEVIEEFRRNGGKVGGFYEGAPLLLLNTTGRKSGKQYTTPQTQPELP